MANLAGLTTAPLAKPKPKPAKNFAPKKPPAAPEKPEAKSTTYSPSEPTKNTDIKVSDWEFAGIGSVGASVGLAGGGWVFSFRSKSANCWGDFVMLGVGVGTPGVSVEVSLPSFSEADLSWSKITCKRAFSLSELAWLEGEILSGGVSVLGLGYSRLYASAGLFHRALFSMAVNDGYSVIGEKVKDVKGLKVKGVNAGAVAATGTWVPCGSVVKKFLEALGTTVIVAGMTLVNTLGGGLFAAGEALLEGRGLAVAFKFANGYASMLADLTDASPDLSDQTFGTLKNLDWAARLQEYGGMYIENGSEASHVLSAVEQAGAAALLQTVFNYGNTYGGDAWLKARKKHRARYGEDEAMRYSAYLDILYAQIKRGDKTIGIRIDI